MDVLQLRLEISEATTIGVLSLRTEPGVQPEPLADAFIPLEPDGSPNGSGEYLDAELGSNMDGMPEQGEPPVGDRPPPRTLRVRHSGGCRVQDTPQWSVLMILFACWFVRRKRQSS